MAKKDETIDVITAWRAQIDQMEKDIKKAGDGGIIEVWFVYSGQDIVRHGRVRVTHQSVKGKLLFVQVDGDPPVGSIHIIRTNWVTSA